jgi:hypothetical protein
LFQRLSAVKVDKEADRRMEIEESQYIERSTFDDVCGEAYVVATDIDNAEEIFDDTMTQPQQQQDAGRKSIVVSVRKVPDFLGPNLNQDVLTLINLVIPIQARRVAEAIRGPLV